MSLFKALSVFEITKKITSLQVQCVRYRYHAEKLAKGKLLRRFGYKETILEKGLLPHVDGPKLPIPEYRPKDFWNDRRALFGQNDYIDILGNDRLHPTKLLKDVPAWLRGFKGNEFQHCLRRKRMMAHSSERYLKPVSWHNMEKRIKYLYRYLNKKTKTGFTDKPSG